MGVSTFRCVAIFVVVVLGTFVLSQDYPTYSELDLPRTRFSCKNKINGGYYADIETDCQMYHVCSRDKDGVMRSTRFLCGNGTVFDQRQLVCQDYRRVQRCKESRKYYRNVGTVLVGVQPRLRSERRHQEVIDEDYPTYSELALPETSFSCEGKVNGGYYADIETKCQMYHVCSRDKDGFMKSTRFLCGNGTVFDQRQLVCQDYRRVQRCHDSRKYYRNVANVLVGLRPKLRSEKRHQEIIDEDYPTYSELDLPETSFSCEDKVNGGYYADIETKCQMYHICSRDKVGVMRSTRFLCGNGTVFDQQHLVCQDYRRVPKCKDSRKYYRNVATILELLEARLRSEKGVKAIMDEATFDSQRFK